MINPRHLASLNAISEHGSFSAAGAAIGRSHSAVSLHVKALEESLGTQLLDRTVRPPALTPDGEALVEQARRLARVLEDIDAIGRSEHLAGTLAVGIVPTAMTDLAPPALAKLRAGHPEVQITIRTGLSGELAQAVRTGELDAAVLTAPDLPPEGLELKPIVEEPLVVVAPATAAEQTDAGLLAAHPFIWFSRKTWAGQQIERRLLDRGIRVRASMEIDSLEAIEALVRNGLGISVVPMRAAGADLRQVPFCQPQAVRRVVLALRPRTPKARLVAALHNALVEKSDG